MQIKTIEMRECTFSEEEGRFHAMLLLEGGDEHVCLHARAWLSPNAQRREVTRLLVADALRQLSRMPEYRCGQAQITLAAQLAYPDT